MSADFSRLCAPSREHAIMRVTKSSLIFSKGDERLYRGFSGRISDALDILPRILKWETSFDEVDLLTKGHCLAFVQKA